MATITRLKPGQIVYDCHKVKQGNTTLRRMGTWTVRIIEVNAAEGWVLASWNGNEPKKFGERKIKKWRISKPESRP